MLGIHTQRAILVLLLVSIAVSIIWAFMGPILDVLGQDPLICAEAGLYAMWLIPSIFAYALLQCLYVFLQAQSIVVPIMWCSAFTTVLHLFVCWVLVLKFGLGNKGTALANGISYWISVLLLALYVKLSPACKETWTGFSRVALRHGTFNFVKLAIPASCLICLEGWAFEVLLLLSGLLPNPKIETSVLSISLNTASALFTIPSDLGTVISTRTSNELGAGRPRAAQLAVRVVVAMAIVEGLVLGVVMVMVCGVWGRAFTGEEVVKYLAIMLPLIAVSSFLDGIQCVFSGVARGCGWQKIGAFVNLGALYVVGIPAGVLFAFFFHLGGKGLWFGFICGICIQMLFLLAVTLRTNWEKVTQCFRYKRRRSAGEMITWRSKHLYD